MAISCQACADLRDIAPTFEILGITDVMCNSLKLNTGLNPNLTTLHNNCQDLQSMLDCLIGTLGQKADSFDNCDWRPFMELLIGNVYQIQQAMLCSDCGQWEAIAQIQADLEAIWVQIRLLWEAIRAIQADITTIYNILNAMSGLNFRTLTKGTDYNIYFYNDFRTGTASNNDMIVRVNRTGLNSYLRVNTNSANDLYNLQHDNLTTITPKHGDPVEDVPTSHVFRIQFIGDYAEFNTATWADTSGSGNGIWNTYPKADRASWQVIGNAYQGTSRGTGFTFTLSSLADGYNTTYGEWYTNPLEGRYLNFGFEITLGI